MRSTSSRAVLGVFAAIIVFLPGASFVAAAPPAPMRTSQSKTSQRQRPTTPKPKVVPPSTTTKTAPRTTPSVAPGPAQVERGGAICEIDPTACPPVNPRSTPLAPAPPRPTPRSGVAAPPAPPPVPPPQPLAPAIAEAQWQQAMAFANARLTQAAVRTLAPIAQNPLHPHHRDALARLALFARETPDGADLERWFGAATPASIATLPDAPGSPRDAAMVLVGKHRYLAGSYEEAARALAAVDAKDPLKPRALFYESAAQTRLGRSVPAVQALQRLLAVLDAAPPSLDRAYFHDLALVSTARIYFGASVRLDENDAPTVDSSKLSAAAKYFEMVDTASPLWPDVAHELAWVFFLADDHSRADGHARFLTAGAADGSHAASALVMRAVIAFSNCRYDEAEAHALALRRMADPQHAKLAALISQTAVGGDAAFATLLADFRDGRTIVEPAIVGFVGRVLVDHGIARRMTYLRHLDAEAAGLAQSGALSASLQGVEARAAVDIERARVMRGISSSARASLEGARDDLAAAIADAQNVLTHVLAAKRNQLDAAIAGSLVTVRESERNILKPQPVQLDPFERRLPDHVRRYPTMLFYSEVRSKCGR